MNEQFENLEDYDAEIPEHIRKYLLDKKIKIQDNFIDNFFDSKNLKVLDAGCGTGWHIKKMSECGYDVVGIDSSPKQCEQARQNSSADILLGSACQLPFEDKSFDVIYTINVLHHLPNKDLQSKALIEFKRVLKTNGLLIIHEINVHNPLIRFYMNYVFPKLRGIDSGAELWLSPEIISKISSGFSLLKTHYYTFIPDFTPKFLMKPLIFIEKYLEKGLFYKNSAHFVSFLKSDDCSK